MESIYRLSINLLFILFQLYSLKCLSREEYTYDDISPFRDFYIVENNTLLLSAQGGIVSIQPSNLTKEFFRQEIDGKNWLMVYNADQKTIVQCNQSDTHDISQCSELYLNLTFTDKSIQEMTVDTTRPPVYTISEVEEVSNYSSILAIGANSLEVLNRKYGIVTFDLENLQLFQTRPNNKGPMNLERGNSDHITFKTVLSTNEHIYFFYHFQRSGENLVNSRIGKLCKNYNSTESQGLYVHSYEDMQLKCTVGTNTFDRIQGAVSTKLDNNDTYILIRFTSQNRNAVCGYHKDTLDGYFKQARFRSLRCGTDTRRFNRYFKPTLNISLSDTCVNYSHSNYADSKCSPTNSLFCADAMGDFCHTSIVHTFLSPDPSESKNGIYRNDDLNFSAMKVIKSMYFNILYIGTSDGQIITIYLKPDDPLQSNNTKHHTITNGAIKKIETDETGVYVLTNEKLEKIYFENCSIYFNCSSCLKSFNPFCGWDLMNNKCTGERNDTSGILFLPPETGQCIELNVQPNRFWIDIKIVTQKMTFNVPSFLQDHGKDDIEFGFMDDRLNKILENSCRPHGSYSFNCTLNEGKNSLATLQPGNYVFFLKYNGTVIAEEDILFYRCAEYKSCKECLPMHNCGWNATNAQCVRTGFNICPEVLQNTDCGSECPSIGSMDHRYDYDIYSSNDSDITFPLNWSYTGIDIKIPNLICVAESLKDQDLITEEVMAKIENNTVSCSGLNITHVHSYEAKQAYKIRLKHENGAYVDGNIKVYAFTCMSVLKPKVGCLECKKVSEQFPTTCFWCNERNKCYSVEHENDMCSGQTNSICPVHIYDIFPRSGPINGGSQITIYGNNFDPEENMFSIKFGTFPCTDINLLNTTQLTCKTTNVSMEATIEYIDVSVNGTNFTFHSNSSNWFTYKIPSKGISFSPTKSILSGGRAITIIGTNLAFHGNNRYDIQLCSQSCIECSDVHILNESSIVCLSGNASTPEGMRLEVTIDNNTKLSATEMFYYVPDPANISLSDKTSSVQQSGGAGIEIGGSGFNNVGAVTIERVEKPCDIKSDILVRCETPPYSGNTTITDPVTESVKVHFDGLEVIINLQYTGDPTFEKFASTLEYDTESTIQIKGQRLLQGATEEDYTITIGLDGGCDIKDMANTHINCLPPENVPRTTHSDENIVAVKVKVGKIKQYIGDLKYIPPLPVLIIIIVVLAIAFVISVVSGVFATLTMRRKRKRERKQLVMELQTREEMIKKKSREEFADAQLTLKVIQGDLVTSAVPYWDFNTYILLQLFPTQDPKSNFLVLYRQITDDDKGKDKSAFDKLDILLQNKLFLKSLIQTLDRPNKLTVQEKAQFGAVLSISLLGNMRLFYDLIQCLLAEKIKSSPKKQLKVLFRRFESITFRLIATWLHVTLYKQLVDKNGVSLFMLLRAVQTIIEREPIDDLTGNSKYTLAEEKLLKIRVEYETLTLNINLNGNSDHCFPVRVLDCDTISQVKRKCCLQIYKNTPGSEIPKFEELVLEWLEGKNGKLLLEDIDNTSERISGLVRLNTLKHYGVRDNCKMALLYGEHDDDELYMNYVHEREQVENVSADDIDVLVPGGSDKDEFNQKWHLESSASNLPDDEKSNMTHDIGEIYLNRLMHTKLLMSTYIDSTFEALMDIKTLSTPIQFFLCMFDKLGKDYNIDDDILQIWKNECYGTRLWSPLIAKPQRIFDVHVPGHVEPVMDILSHVFVECFTQTSTKVNKDSSPQKLLFHQDVETHRKDIAPFFASMEPVSDMDFYRSLEQMSEIHKKDLQISRQSVIHHLYNLFIAHNKEDILMDFEDMEESKDLQFAAKLQEVFDLIGE